MLGKDKRVTYLQIEDVLSLNALTISLILQDHLYVKKLFSPGYQIDWVKQRWHDNLVQEDAKNI